MLYVKFCYSTSAHQLLTLMLRLEYFTGSYTKTIEATVVSLLPTHLTTGASNVLQTFILPLSFFSVTLSDGSGKPGSLFTCIFPAVAIIFCLKSSNKGKVVKKLLK